MKICKVESKREVIDTKYEVCNKYCCETLEKWLTIESNYRHALSWHKETGRFKILVKESDDDHYGYRDDDSYKSVKLDLIYCPFCGEKLQEPEPEKKQKKKPFRRKK